MANFKSVFYYGSLTGPTGSFDNILWEPCVTEASWDTAWTSLISIGSKLAAMFGVKTVLGVGGTTLFSSVLTSTEKRRHPKPMNRSVL